jgi:hypothetical protein
VNLTQSYTIYTFSFLTGVYFRSLLTLVTNFIKLSSIFCFAFSEIALLFRIRINFDSVAVCIAKRADCGARKACKQAVSVIVVSLIPQPSSNLRTEDVISSFDISRIP